MPQKFIDESGNKYGLLTVQNYQGKKLWLCQCECGNTKLVRGTDLRSGHIKTCGCRSTVIKNELGKRYGKLLVLEKIGAIPDRGIYWKCKCDCGNIVEVSGKALRSGGTKSCGCLKSYGEQLIGEILQNNNINYKKEYTYDDLYSKNNKKLRFDFYLPDLNILIEFHGSQHDLPNKYYNKNKRNSLEEIKLRDNSKEIYCSKHKISLLIFHNKNNKYDKQVIEENILNFIKEEKIKNVEISHIYL